MEEVIGHCLQLVSRVNHGLNSDSDGRSVEILSFHFFLLEKVDNRGYGRPTVVINRQMTVHPIEEHWLGVARHQRVDLRQRGRLRRGTVIAD